jgi:hypothetical protein
MAKAGTTHSVAVSLATLSNVSQSSGRIERAPFVHFEEWPCGSRPSGR